jgi:hypothetical protein
MTLAMFLRMEPALLSSASHLARLVRRRGLNYTG